MNFAVILAAHVFILVVVQATPPNLTIFEAGNLESNETIRNSSNKDQRAAMTKLKEHLLHGYDPYRVPLGLDGQAVNVSLYMWPYDILYVNEAKSSIKISGWLDYHWTDVQLAWKPSEWAGITHMFLPALSIWLPRIDIFYSKEEGAGFVQCRECYVRLDFHGRILRGQYFSYSFPCKINVKYFPFDKQSCSLEVANWFLDDQNMDLYPHGDTNIDMSVFLPNEEWDLLNITVTRKNEFYNYGFFPSLTYRIHIKRKPFYYICNLIAPSVIITTTAVIGYHMPSTSQGVHQEKVKMGLTAILSIFILQLGIVDKLPRTSDVIPLINIFYFCLVWILSSAIVVTSMIIVIEKNGLSGRPIPPWARKTFLEPWTIRIWSRGRPTHCGYTYNSLDCERYLKTMSCTCRATPTETTRLMNPESVENSPKFRGANANRMLSQATMSTAAVFAANCTHTKGAPTTGYCGGGMPIELLTCLNTVRASVEQICEQIREQKQSKAARVEWARLADRVERVSLYGFLCGIAFSIVLFIFHSWY